MLKPTASIQSTRLTRNLARMSGSNVTVEIPFPDQQFAAYCTLKIGLAFGLDLVQSGVLVQVARIAEGAVANFALQRLEAGRTFSSRVCRSRCIGALGQFCPGSWPQVQPYFSIPGRTVPAVSSLDAVVDGADVEKFAELVATL
ncbi:conserved hypothetical protein [Trichinella spiralis]|uniref:hypothetical protein n=1 Tax=Trichinella spiralis TaxID=6334 RepID=UPI0001EFB61F|nr:conserved hypothetical protein [Trichinella spiralis]